MPEDVPSNADDLLPILIIEELAKSDRPLSVNDVFKKLDLGEAILVEHFNALAEDGYIVAYGSPTTFVLSKRTATLATDVLSK